MRAISRGITRPGGRLFSNHHLLVVTSPSELNGSVFRGPLPASRDVTKPAIHHISCINSPPLPPSLDMGSNNPPFWQNSSFVDFNSYGDRSVPTDYRQQPVRPPYPHPDWSERPDQGDQRISRSTFNPTFQSLSPYLSQPNSYDNPPGHLAPVQQQPLRIPFSAFDSANANADSSGLPGDPFVQSNEEYHRGGSSFPLQQRITFGNQALAQISPPPALYHPGQALDHPGGQAYRHQVLPLSDVTTEKGPLDLFGGSSIRSRVPSQDGWVCRSCAQGI